MEEDNADDIIKWLFKNDIGLDCQAFVETSPDGSARQTRWEARLRGNLMVLKPMDIVNEPLLFVCEKLDIIKSNGTANTLCLKQNNREWMMTFQDEKEMQKWMVKLRTSSHRISQAEYDQILCAHFSHKYMDKVSGAETRYNYFLTSSAIKEQSFSLFQSANVPNKQIICREIMYESKLSILVPQEMIKMSLKWTTELRDELLNKLWNIRNTSMVDTLHMAIRHLNSNIEVQTQASEFLDSYIGPFFRPSTEKYRVSFLYVPINLHVQFFSINEKQLSSIITSGALAALPLRFSYGGLYRLRNKFAENISPNSMDHTNESRYYKRRQILLSTKRKIGDLSRRIDTDKIGNGKILIELFSEAKQIRETVMELINSYPNIYNLVDSLCEGGLAQMQHKSGEAVPRDTLTNQVNYLDAQFDSLNSKITALLIENRGTGENQIYGENVHSSFNVALDELHHLILSLESAQTLSLVQCLRNKNECQLFFHLQLRHDALLSQALSITISAILTAVYNPNTERISYWEFVSPLLTCFGFLSCYGDEQGMIEDTLEIWQLFPTIASFRFIATNSSVTQNCCPQIDGFRTDVKVSIPLPPQILATLPENLSKGQWFCPKIVLWNLGINHEASLATTFGDNSLEEHINRMAVKQILEYVMTLQSTNGELKNGETLNKLLTELQQTVAANPSRKNTSIFNLAMEINDVIGGMCVLSCKSGKDRTSMAVTLEEGRILKETSGISNQQMQKIVECLRKNGIRRQNCAKNIGKPMYSFSPFQMNFLPKEFRPPLGTFTNMVAS